MIAASLKCCHIRILTAKAANFRDQMIAASLKPACGGSFRCACADFRDQMIAASLKLVDTNFTGGQTNEFPRSDDRGLIEARQRPEKQMKRDRFPRSDDQSLKGED